MSRRTWELNIESPQLLKFLQDLDARNMDMGVKNSMLWFGDAYDETSLRLGKLYTPIVQLKEGKYSMKVKVKCADRPTNIFIVDDDTNGLKYHKGTPDDLMKNVKCMCIVETNGLWFMNKKSFGMSFVATDIMVWPNKRPTGIGAFALSGAPKLEMSEMQVEKMDEVEDN